MCIKEAKQLYAMETRRGADLILGSVLLCGVFGGLGLVLPQSSEGALIYLFGGGLLFPLGRLIAAIRGRDLLVWDNPLTILAGLLGAVQVLFILLVLGAYFLVPKATPWLLAILLGARFLPFSGLYDNLAYLFCSVAIIAASATVGLLAPDSVFTTTPFAVVAIVLCTDLLLAHEQVATREVVK